MDDVNPVPVVAVDEETVEAPVEMPEMHTHVTGSADEAEVAMPAEMDAEEVAAPEMEAHEESAA